KTPYALAVLQSCLPALLDLDRYAPANWRRQQLLVLSRWRCAPRLLLCSHISMHGNVRILAGLVFIFPGTENATNHPCLKLRLRIAVLGCNPERGITDWYVAIQ